MSETGTDWSDYTTSKLGTSWRRSLKLVRIEKGLRLVIRNSSHTGCQGFMLAPYVACTSTPVFWKIQICLINGTRARVITVRTDINQPLTIPSMTLSPTTPDDAILTATGVSGLTNNWLLLTEEAGRMAHQSCMVCMGARPLLRIVPVAISLRCIFPVMKFTNPSPNCTQWDKVYPVVQSRQTPIFSSDVAEGNFTCVNMSLGPLIWERYPNNGVRTLTVLEHPLR